MSNATPGMNLKEVLCRLYTTKVQFTASVCQRAARLVKQNRNDLTEAEDSLLEAVASGERPVADPEHTVDLLSRVHAEADEGSEFVFLSRAWVGWIKAKREAGTWSEGQDVLNNVNKNFKRRAYKAGVRNVTFHDLRQSCITNWAWALPIHMVRELAGHADIRTAQAFYLAVSQQDMEAARQATANVLQVDPK